ncbi:MAG: hypothetical protein LAO20_19075 [Acidobacteriia bacterium]|nr:hypothetical protein [Terriglobia bacterium]
MNLTTCIPMMDTYFAQLNAKLSDLPDARRQDFLRELRAHVLDRLEQVATPTQDDCRNVLQALGTPDEIARHYRMEMILRSSSWSLSPFKVLRTTLRWTVAGVQGYLVFVVAVIGYLLSASFYICALLKPFFPQNVGFYVGDFGFNLAQFPVQHGHEVFAPYFIPITILLGYLTTFGTTLLIRFLIRHLSQLRKRI